MPVVVVRGHVCIMFVLVLSSLLVIRDLCVVLVACCHLSVLFIPPQLSFVL